MHERSEHVLFCPRYLDVITSVACLTVLENIQPAPRSLVEIDRARTCRELFSVIGLKMYFYFPKDEVNCLVEGVLLLIGVAQRLWSERLCAALVG